MNSSRLTGSAYKHSALSIATLLGIAACAYWFLTGHEPPHDQHASIPLKRADQRLTEEASPRQSPLPETIAASDVELGQPEPAQDEAADYVVIESPHSGFLAYQIPLDELPEQYGHSHTEKDLVMLVVDYDDSSDENSGMAFYDNFREIPEELRPKAIDYLNAKLEWMWIRKTYQENEVRLGRAKVARSFDEMKQLRKTLDKSIYDLAHDGDSTTYYFVDMRAFMEENRALTEQEEALVEELTAALDRVGAGVVLQPPRF